MPTNSSVTQTFSVLSEIASQDQMLNQIEVKEAHERFLNLNI